MKKCQVCHNEYENCFTVQIKGKQFDFDSFECAIHALAPRCHHCGCTIIGHGVEANAIIYCGAHCARSEGHKNLKDQGNISIFN